MRAIVFDLDGTLIDSDGDIRAALNRTLAARGLAPFTERETAGPGGAGRCGGEIDDRGWCEGAGGAGVRGARAGGGAGGSGGVSGGL
jgi:phosphoglycolate phosphatase-like HAD superfamily hydrolase